MYVFEVLCPFRLNEAHCDELCVMPVSGETSIMVLNPVMKVLLLISFSKGSSSRSINTVNVQKQHSLCVLPDSHRQSVTGALGALFGSKQV